MNGKTGLYELFPSYPSFSTMMGEVSVGSWQKEEKGAYVHPSSTNEKADIQGIIYILLASLLGFCGEVKIVLLCWFGLVFFKANQCHYIFYPINIAIPCDKRNPPHQTLAITKCIKVAKYIFYFAWVHKLLNFLVSLANVMSMLSSCLDSMSLNLNII